LCLGFLHLVVGEPFGDWNTRPRGAYACLWAALVTGFGICAGLFFWGIASVAARYETGQVQINPLSGTNAFFGGMLILVSAGRILYLGGVAMGLFAPPTGITHAEQQDLAKQQESLRWQQQRAAQQAVEQTARTNVAQEWIRYLHEGGQWTMEVFPSLASEVAEPDLGLASATGAPPSAAAAGGGGSGIPAPRFHVLVLGPPDLLQTKPTILFGTPVEGLGNDVKERVEAYLQPTDVEARRQFLQAIVDAVAQQEIGAAVVEVVPASPPNSATSPGSATAGSSIGASGDAEASTAASLPELQVGMPISLEAAKAVSSAELRQWLGLDLQP
jgi:hypothetical protein